MNTKQQEKLINAITYFIRETKICYEVKIYKLLYFLDFEHFGSTGKTVTGLDYYAWLKGPVPLELKLTFEQIANSNSLQEEGDSPLKSILNSNFSFEKDHDLHINPKTEFTMNVFTKREYNLLQTLAKKYQHHTGEEMIIASHDKVWDLTYRQEPGSRIDYFLALSPSLPITKEDIQSREFENKMIRATYGLK